MIYLYYSDMFMSYNFGPEHPMQPARLMLTQRMIEEYGFLYSFDVELTEPYYVSDEDLLKVHSPEYIEAVRSETPDPAFGLSESDNPVFPGIYDASRIIAGASVEAANRVSIEGCSAFNFAGGLHHAMPSLASGFCIFNDCALAIMALRKRLGRVLYIDIDGHHGDGVQHIFYHDPTVLTISLHESGRYIFPGTGFIDELGYGEGRGYSVNVPMPQLAGDSAYSTAFDQIVPPLFAWFKPDVVVAQLGVDTHYYDPLTTLSLTLSGYAYLVKRIRELADRHCGGRLLALGGGGYNLEVVPLAWAMAFQLLKGEEMPEKLPQWWIDAIMNMVGRPPLSLPDLAIRLDDDTERRIREELAETLADLKVGLSDIHGSIF